MSIIPLASMAPPAKHKPIGITTLVIRSCERDTKSSQSNERNNSIVRERARERTREINTLKYTAASRRDIDIDAYRSTLLQVHEPLLALEKLRRFSRVAYPPCASRQSSNAPCRRENNRFSSSPRRFHRECVAIARRASVETPTLDSDRSIDRFFRGVHDHAVVVVVVAFRFVRIARRRRSYLLRLGNLIAHRRLSVR